VQECTAAVDKHVAALAAAMASHSPPRADLEPLLAAAHRFVAYSSRALAAKGTVSGAFVALAAAATAPPARADALLPLALTAAVASLLDADAAYPVTAAAAIDALTATHAPRFAAAAAALPAARGARLAAGGAGVALNATLAAALLRACRAELLDGSMRLPAAVAQGLTGAAAAVLAAALPALRTSSTECLGPTRGAPLHALVRACAAVAEQMMARSAFVVARQVSRSVNTRSSGMPNRAMAASIRARSGSKIPAISAAG